MTYKPDPYKINNIISYTDDIKLFRIKSKLNPMPGQFIEVSIPGIGECPLASCSYDSNFIDMLTRKAGNVTSALFQKKKNDFIFIRGPYGQGFPIKELINNNLILIAGGTGIAPVTSLIEYIEKNKKQFKEIIIYFAFRNEKYILLSEKIKNWKKKFNLTITIDKKLDPKDNKFICEIGYLQDVLDKKNPVFKDFKAILCGPEPMMQCVTDKLLYYGLKPSDIYWSMERRMECGFGSCNRCLIQDTYVCKDGPIFKYDFIKPKLDNEMSSNKQQSIEVKK